jgi:hypothetical protein
MVYCNFVKILFINSQPTPRPTPWLVNKRGGGWGEEKMFPTPGPWLLEEVPNSPRMQQPFHTAAFFRTGTYSTSPHLYSQITGRGSLYSIVFACNTFFTWLPSLGLVRTVRPFTFIPWFMEEVPNSPRMQQPFHTAAFSRRTVHSLSFSPWLLEEVPYSPCMHDATPFSHGCLLSNWYVQTAAFSHTSMYIVHYVPWHFFPGYLKSYLTFTAK